MDTEPEPKKMPFKRITLEDLGLTKEEMEAFAAGSRFLYGTTNDDEEAEDSTDE